MNTDELKYLPIDINRLILPLEYNYASIGDIIYSKYDDIHKWQPLTKTLAGDNYNIALHSAFSGQINSIDFYPTLQSLGNLNNTNKVLSMEIVKNEAITQAQTVDHLNSKIFNYSDFINFLAQNGIIGLGGAGFPTGKKLDAELFDAHYLDTIVVNAMECESPISTDNCLIINFAQNIISGLIIINQVLQPKHIIIAIKKDMVRAINALRESLTVFPYNLIQNISIQTFEQAYPYGYSKTIINLVTKKNIPLDKHSSEYGIICLNVATIYAIEQAVNFNKPLVDRIVTITGDLISQPGNYLLPIGTPISKLLEAFNIDLNSVSNTKGIIIYIGGQYMGYELFNSHNPMHMNHIDYLDYISIEKTTQAIQFLSTSAVHKDIKNYAPCIKCGYCESICPVGLLPQQLFWFGQGLNTNNNNELLEKYSLNTCIECGLCDSACPSNIPLTAIFKNLKTEINYNKYKQLKSKEAELNNRLMLQKRETITKLKTQLTNTQQTNKKSLLLDSLKLAKNKKTLLSNEK